MASKPDNNIDLVMISTTTTTTTTLSPIKAKATILMTVSTTPTIIRTTTPKTSTIMKTTPAIAIAAAGAAITKTPALTSATRTTTSVVQTKLSENRGKWPPRLHPIKGADRLGGQFRKNKTATARTTTPMTAVALEKTLVTQQPSNLSKNLNGDGVGDGDSGSIRSKENISPQKTIDYNSIAEEFTEQNGTVIDLIMQTQLKTEPITTPEPRKDTTCLIFVTYACP